MEVGPVVSLDTAVTSHSASHLLVSASFSHCSLDVPEVTSCHSVINCIHLLLYTPRVLSELIQQGTQGPRSRGDITMRQQYGPPLSYTKESQGQGLLGPENK